VFQRNARFAVWKPVLDIGDDSTIIDAVRVAVQRTIYADKRYRLTPSTPIGYASTHGETLRTRWENMTPRKLVAGKRNGMRFILHGSEWHWNMNVRCRWMIKENEKRAKDLKRAEYRRLRFDTRCVDGRKIATSVVCLASMLTFALMQQTCGTCHEGRPSAAKNTRGERIQQN
jgi:hypothetical protein